MLVTHAEQPLQHEERPNDLVDPNNFCIMMHVLADTYIHAHWIQSKLFNGPLHHNLLPLLLLLMPGITPGRISICPDRVADIPE